MAGSSGQPTIGFLPWQAEFSKTGTWVRNNTSAMLGMGEFYQSPIAQNNEVSWNIWLDAGTYKYCHVFYKDSGQGIHHVRLDDVDVGTIDAYAAASSNNNYAEVTGITVATAGVKKFSIKAATKNASSSNYQTDFSSCAWIKTAGAHSSGSGGDTPGTTWIYLPWMGSKANTNWNTRLQNSALFGGGRLESSGAQNAEISWDIWLEAGTYKYAQIATHGTSVGIHHIQLDGSDVGTIDGYAGANSNNNYAEVTGIVIATAGVKTFKLKMATKNASSSNYEAYINSVAWLKTA